MTGPSVSHHVSESSKLVGVYVVLGGWFMQLSFLVSKHSVKRLDWSGATLLQVINHRKDSGSEQIVTFVIKE